MPMIQPLRMKLMGALEILRPDWTESEINAATRTLADQAGEPGILFKQAIDRHLDASNRRAVCITWPVADGPPAVRRGQCKDHCGTTVNATGEFVCCVQAKAESQVDA